jgi:L-amino acid N-acyltransferase YncA
VSAPDTRIRPAVAEDAEAVAAIYAEHVLTGTASFDTDPPDAAFWSVKILAVTGRGWPFLIAEEAGETAGFAYATQFRDRPAYAFTCENSIYVAADRRGRGLGTALLPALVAAAEAAGFRQMVAVIGGAEPASAALHARAGFREAGRMRSVGRKQGRWLDTLYMQRALGPGDSQDPE